MEKGMFFLLILFLSLTLSTTLIPAPFGYDNPNLPQLKGETFDDHLSSFYMPLNTSVFGNFSFNGGWQNNGLSIVDGDIYARTGYFFNITSLNVTQQNLTILEDAYFNGKVGIGTSSPTANLHVAGTMNIDGNVQLDGDVFMNAAGKSLLLTNNDLYVYGGGKIYFDSSGLGAGGSYIYSPVDTGGDIAIVGNVGIGTATPASTLQVAGAISSATNTITVSADNISVSGINVLFINPAGATVIGGFRGGVAGQMLYISALSNGQDITLEHNEGVSDQNVFLHTGGDETLSTEYGGWTLACNGTNWYDTEHSKHV